MVVQAEAEEVLQGLASLRARQGEVASMQHDQQLALADLQVLHPHISQMPPHLCFWWLVEPHQPLDQAYVALQPYGHIQEHALPTIRTCVLETHRPD